MADRDSSSIRVDACRIVRDAELSQHSECLRRERFIELDHIDVAEGQSSALEDNAGRRHWADSHDAGRNARNG
jgi:hypothetical protein